MTGESEKFLTAEKFVDYQDKANALSVDLYGKSYDTIQQETQPKTEKANAGQGLAKEQSQGRTSAASQVAKPSPSTKSSPEVDKMTERDNLYRSFVGMTSHIHSMPQGEQAQYSDKLTNIQASSTYGEYRDRVNDLSLALYGQGYDTIRQNREHGASPDQDLSEGFSREPAQEIAADLEPGSREDVLDAARYIAKEMGESDFAGGRSYESNQFKIEIYGNDVKVFDHDGNKAIDIDEIGGIDSYQPTPELVGVLTESANELEQQDAEHDHPRPGN